MSYYLRRIFFFFSSPCSLIKTSEAAGWNGSWKSGGIRHRQDYENLTRERKRCLTAELQPKWVFNHAVNVGEMWGPETAQIASMRYKTPSGEPNGQITSDQITSWWRIKCAVVDTLNPDYFYSQLSHKSFFFKCTEPKDEAYESQRSVKLIIRS